MIESELIRKNFFSKGYTKNWSRETFVINSVSKPNPSKYKTKDSNGERIIGYYLKPDNHIRDKVKVVLDLSNYTTKNN